MKIRDRFKSMEEVRQYAEQFKSDPETYKAVLFLLGLSPQEGISKDVAGIGLVNISVADEIASLNQRGLTTLASCSGLRCDHPQKEHLADGYLSFLKTEEIRTIVKKCATRLALEYEEGETYLRPSCTIRMPKCGDGKKKQLWESLFSLLRKTQ